MDVNIGNGMKVKGFVEIEIYNKKTGVNKHKFYNTVTKLGKMLMLSRAADKILMGFSGSPYGRVESVDMLGTIAYMSISGSSTSALHRRYTLPNNGLNLYLANLGPDANLTEDTKFVNLMDSSFNVDYTKIVGFANNRDVTGNIREGVQDYTRHNHMSNDKCVAARWKFAEGVATGTFDHILIMPGIHGNIKTNGVYLKKCITGINQFNDIASFNNSFIIPGVPGITNSNEILLNFNRNSVTRWKYNIETGELVQVNPGDVAYEADMYANPWCQMYVNGYLYIAAGGDGTTSGGNGILAKIDPTTGETEKSVTIANWDIVTHGLGMFFDGTNIIAMSTYNTNEGSYNDYPRVRTINPSTLSTISSVYKVDWTGWGGIPPGWSRNRMIVKKCGQYYFVHHGYEVIQCTDLMDISGSAVNAFLAHPRTHYVQVGDEIWTIEKGVGYLDYSKVESNGIYNTPKDLLANIYYGVKDNSTNQSLIYTNNGIWISRLWSGNLISFVKLPTPINKAENDIMYVSYGYEFV